MLPLLYIFAIVAANVVTAATEPLNLVLFIVPYGTFVIGISFILRDLVQSQFGRARTYGFILLSTLLSALTSYLHGDTLWIVFASLLTFLISETTDTEIYSRLKLPFHMRLLYSGTVAGVLDSTVFVVVGLSPLGAGFIPWSAVPLAILGQIVVKTLVQLLGALISKPIIAHFRISLK
ncbi:MAG TPA: VUT family protein [Bacilli bacterium]